MNKHDTIGRIIADLIHNRPAASELDYLGFRFRHGVADIAERPCDEADVTRAGGYCLYAVRTKLVPLGVALAPVTFWTPSVYFIPNDEAMRPEEAYDGSPLRRGVKAVPISEGGRTLSKDLLARLFGHLELPKALLAEHGRQTGRRWEILAEQERRRCKAAGKPCSVSELPDDMRSMS